MDEWMTCCHSIITIIPAVAYFWWQNNGTEEVFASPAKHFKQCWCCRFPLCCSRNLPLSFLFLLTQAPVSHPSIHVANEWTPSVPGSWTVVLDHVGATQVYFNKNSAHFVLSRGNGENKILVKNRSRVSATHLAHWVALAVVQLASPRGQRVAPISSQLIDTDPRLISTPAAQLVLPISQCQDVSCAQVLAKK